MRSILLAVFVSSVFLSCGTNLDKTILPVDFAPTLKSQLGDKRLFGVTGVSYVFSSGEENRVTQSISSGGRVFRLKYDEWNNQLTLEVLAVSGGLLLDRQLLTDEQLHLPNEGTESFSIDYRYQCRMDRQGVFHAVTNPQVEIPEDKLNGKLRRARQIDSKTQAIIDLDFNSAPTFQMADIELLGSSASNSNSGNPPSIDHFDLNDLAAIPRLNFESQQVILDSVCNVFKTNLPDINRYSNSRFSDNTSWYVKSISKQSLELLGKGLGDYENIGGLSPKSIQDRTLFSYTGPVLHTNPSYVENLTSQFSESLKGQSFYALSSEDYSDERKRLDAVQMIIHDDGKTFTLKKTDDRVNCYYSIQGQIDEVVVDLQPLAAPTEDLNTYFDYLFSRVLQSGILFKGRLSATSGQVQRPTGSNGHCSLAQSLMDHPEKPLHIHIQYSYGNYATGRQETRSMRLIHDHSEMQFVNVNKY